MSELTRRVLVAVIAAPAAIAIVFAGGAPMAALLAIASALAAWELFRIARAGGAAPMDDVGIALAGVLPLAVHAHYLGLFTTTPAIAVIVVLALCAISIWTRGVTGRPLSSVAITAFGVIYTGGALSFAYALRYHEFVRFFDGAPGVGAVGLGGRTMQLSIGALLLLLPLLVTWASDIGAFFVGRAVGGRKLIPAVSPGKTVSGAIGGLLASMLVAWLYARLVLRPVGQLGFTTGGALLFGLVVSVAAQVGDLFESLLKREGGVKDSSKLLPGHGGVLDRVDSLLFVLPVAYLLAGWLLRAAPTR